MRFDRLLEEQRATFDAKKAIMATGLETKADEILTNLCKKPEYNEIQRKHIETMQETFNNTLGGFSLRFHDHLKKQENTVNHITSDLVRRTDQINKLEREVYQLKEKNSNLETGVVLFGITTLLTLSFSIFKN